MVGQRAGTWLMAAIAALLLSGMALTSSAADKAIVTVRGSTSMEGLLRQWAQDFMKEHPDVKVSVEAHGSQVGLRALKAGEADIAMVSRRIHPHEARDFIDNGIRLVDTPVAVEGIAIVVNKSNPIDEIRFDELGKIFTGDYTSWKDLGGPDKPIEVVVRPTLKSGTAMTMRENVLVYRPFAKNAVVKNYYEGTLLEVERRPGAVTFAPLNKALEADVKILAIKMSDTSVGLKPQDEIFNRRSYPLTRFFHLYHDASAPAHVKQFVQYCWSRGLGAR